MCCIHSSHFEHMFHYIMEGYTHYAKFWFYIRAFRYILGVLVYYVHYIYGIFLCVLVDFKRFGKYLSSLAYFMHF